MTDSVPTEPARTTPLARVKDGGHFIRQWAENPMGVGAVAPSGPGLARAMAGFLDPELTGQVVELGPGTGVVTKAILARGVAADKLTCIEYSKRFVHLLQERFTGVSICQGDAYDLGATLGATGGDQAPLAGIVSSLPLLSSPCHKRRALILDALERLAPGAPFIQFSYSLVPPVREEPSLFSLTKTGWIWNNMPPARVWVYRKISP